MQKSEASPVCAIDLKVTAGIPKLIHVLWLQGIEQSPEWVQRNFERTRTLNPDYEIILYTENDVQRLLHEDCIAVPESITMQALSDVFRIALLKRFGGIWMDASVFLVRPIDDWLQVVTKNSDFFAFDFPRESTRPIASWFLACQKDCYLVDKWYQATCQFWHSERRPASAEDDATFRSGEAAKFTALLQDDEEYIYPYFWFHYLFRTLIESDHEFAKQWAQLNKLSGPEAHAVQKYERHFRKQSLLKRRYHRFVSKKYETKSISCLRAAPVQKLDWRVDYNVAYLNKLANGIAGH